MFKGQGVCDPLIAQCEEIDIGWMGLKGVGNFAVNSAFY
jgi:hypothetical protein